MKIKNRINRVVAIGQSFNQVCDTYGYYYDDKEKCRKFGKVGVRDVYNEIQSHSNESDINFIKENLLCQAPNSLEGNFVDCSDISPDLLTSLMRIENAKESFYSLPIKLREKYNNNFETFAKNVNQNDINDFFGIKPVEKSAELKKEGE